MFKARAPCSEVFRPVAMSGVAGLSAANPTYCKPSLLLQTVALIALIGGTVPNHPEP